MNKYQIRNSLLLLLTATIWGVAFVAQSVGMDYVGPFTFLCVRSVIGGLVLIPYILLTQRADQAKMTRNRTEEEEKKEKKTLILGGCLCGTALCVASLFQQFGILYTTVGKAGFITAFYIIIVPVAGLLFGRRCGLNVWLGVALAVAGLYFLCITETLYLKQGDVLVFICAIFFSVQIMLVDHFAPKVDCVKMACIQFFVCGILSGVGMFIWEQPTIVDILAAWQPILYAGVLSSGVGYPLQIVGQKGLNPTVASLIMSLESVISVLAGLILLHQSLSGREALGCVLMFAAIVLAQLPRKRATAEAKVLSM